MLPKLNWQATIPTGSNGQPHNQCLNKMMHSPPIQDSFQISNIQFGMAFKAPREIKEEIEKLYTKPSLYVSKLPAGQDRTTALQDVLIPVTDSKDRISWASTLQTLLKKDTLQPEDYFNFYAEGEYFASWATASNQNTNNLPYYIRPLFFLTHAIDKEVKNTLPRRPTQISDCDGQFVKIEMYPQKLPQIIPTIWSYLEEKDPTHRSTALANIRKAIKEVLPTSTQGQSPRSIADACLMYISDKLDDLVVFQDALYLKIPDTAKS
jgi:hypothetical protein